MRSHRSGPSGRRSRNSSAGSPSRPRGPQLERRRDLHGWCLSRQSRAGRLGRAAGVG
jgi:hypothetical protein